MTVRRAGPADAARMRDVRLRALADAPEAFDSTLAVERGWTEDVWAQKLTHDATFLFEDANGVHGLAAGTKDARDATIAWLGAVWVAPASRGTGVARALVDAVLDWASTEGAREVRLHAVASDARARRFYAGAGFVETGATVARERDGVVEIEMSREVEEVSKIRVYIACSLDGFIAGPDGDLSWLPPIEEGTGEDYGYAAFVARIGCALMGRATYDAVANMGIDWPMTDFDTIVATTRSLPDPPPRVHAMQGEIGDLVGAARVRAAGKDVYLDGGNLIRQALDAGLVDEMTVSVIPVVLGAGHPLFAGATQRQPLALHEHRAFSNGLVQLVYTPLGKRTS